MKKAALMVGHLEKVSWRVMDEYPLVIREMIRGRHGVYALYRRGRLYYLGLASNLMNRLKTHLKDRHRGAWDRFSVYISIRPDHTKELESLLLRIISPEGNRTGGKFAGSKNLLPLLERRLKEIDADRRASILGGKVARRRSRQKARRQKGASSLLGFVERRTQLRARFKGVAYRATLRPDGMIRFAGKLYDSPAAAATAVVKRPANGWYFWTFKNASGEWARLRTIKS